MTLTLPMLTTTHNHTHTHTHTHRWRLDKRQQAQHHVCLVPCGRLGALLLLLLRNAFNKANVIRAPRQNPWRKRRRRDGRLRGAVERSAALERVFVRAIGQMENGPVVGAGVSCHGRTEKQRVCCAEDKQQQRAEMANDGRRMRRPRLWGI